MKKILELVKELSNEGVQVSIVYDRNYEMFMVDLDTQAKSHLYLYEDGTLRGRYDYERHIDLEQTMGEIIESLCEEFNEALYGRSFGNSYWFDLCSEFDIKCETYA